MVVVGALVLALPVCSALPQPSVLAGKLVRRAGPDARASAQALCPAVVCRSVPFVGALATYNLPLRTPTAPTVPEWLVSCIGDAAKHLDQAPFLQLLLPGRPKWLERHRVTHAVVQAPQVSLTFVH